MMEDQTTNLKHRVSTWLKSKLERRGFLLFLGSLINGFFLLKSKILQAAPYNLGAFWKKKTVAPPPPPPGGPDFNNPDASRLYSWGLNTAGALGLGDLTTRSSPVLVGAAGSAYTTWKFVSGGINFAAAVTSNGELWSWGVNTNFNLGVGDNVTRSSPVRVGGNSDWWKVPPLSGNHMLAIRTDKTLYSWGQNTSGVLGLQDAAVTRSSPTQVGGNTWEQVAAGMNVSFGIQTGGALFAWGANGNGILGLGNTVARSSPVAVGGTDWAKVATFRSFSAGIRTDGTLWTWGLGTSGRLGLGDSTTSYSSPMKVGSDTKWAEIAVGDGHGVAVKTDGSLWSWGMNTQGQLGHGTVVSVSSPVQVAGTLWAKVWCGDNNALALKKTSELWAWGNNASFQLGLGDINARSIPTQVGNLTTWKTVTLGTYAGFGTSD